MNHRRVRPAVGIVTDEVTQEKLIVVTGGFQLRNSLYYNTDASKTTEVLFDGVWSIGKII